MAATVPEPGSTADVSSRKEQGSQAQQGPVGSKAVNNPRATTFQVLGMGWASMAVSVAAQLGIADWLKEGPLPVKTLAQSLEVHEESLFRLMRALAPLGFFSQSADGDAVFGLGPLGPCLVSTGPDSLRSMAVMLAMPEMRGSWSHLEHSVRTGEPAFRHAYGMGMFEWLQQHPDSAACFNRAMTELTVRDAEVVMGAYDFSGVKTLMDVGGGEGQLLCAILQAHPEMKGVLLDLPEVAEDAKKRISSLGLGERCLVLGGSFFERFGTQERVDACMIKNCVHNWGDHHVLLVLQNCHQALLPNGRILLVEYIPPAGDEPHPSKMLDLNMLAITDGGKERSREQHEALLTRAGFSAVRVIPTCSGLSIIEARKIQTEE